MIATAGCEATDAELVAAVRAGDDSAFEELYRRYQPRIARFVCGMLHDAARCEDVAQEAFLSALRRMRATDAEINFKPWIYQIARNAAIDSYRRNSHAVEVSMDADDGLRASDRTRLVGLDGSPDAALVTKERMDHLQGAFDELSDVHTRVLVMRELEGMSYREIGQKLDLTRPAVESALFRARRRLESEYEELSEGRRCEAMAATITRIAAGRAARRGGAATGAPRAPLPQLPPPRSRAWDRAAVRAGRPAPEGRGAAAAALAPASLGRGRQWDRWILRNGCRCGTAGGACRGSCGRGGAGGCGRRGTRDRSASGGPRGGRARPRRGRALRGGDGGTDSAAPPGPPRAGSVGERAGRPGGESPVRQGAAPANTTDNAWRTRIGFAAGHAQLTPSGPATEGSAPGLPTRSADRCGQGSPSVELELSLPEAPPVTLPQTPAPTLPRVELPTVPLPDTGPVTDALAPDVLP